MANFSPLSGDLSATEETRGDMNHHRHYCEKCKKDFDCKYTFYCERPANALCPMHVQELVDEVLGKPGKPGNADKFYKAFDRIFGGIK
jgi:hypothetical protein